MVHTEALHLRHMNGNCILLNGKLKEMNNVFQAKLCLAVHTYVHINVRNVFLLCLLTQTPCSDLKAVILDFDPMKCNAI